MLTIDDLKAAGFVEYQYWGVQHNQQCVVTDPNRLVHKSAAEWCKGKHQFQREHPVIQHELGNGWIARWGAMTFHLKNEVAFWRFMKTFGYPLPIDAAQ
ncbi:hypothetical protein [Fibrisoma montanum]|nr:hypothetical protein [Fibrisoma montanum]